MKRKVVNKLLAVALSATMVLGLAACSGSSEESSSSNSSVSSSSTTKSSDAAGTSSSASSNTESSTNPDAGKFTFGNSFDKMTIYLPANNPNEYGGGNPAYDRLVDEINQRILGEGSKNKIEFSFTIEAGNAETGESGYYTIVNQNLTVPKELADVTRYSDTPSTNAAFINAATGAGQVVVDTPAVYKKDAEGKDTNEIETPAVTHIEASGVEVFWDLAPYIEMTNPDGSYVYPNLAAWKDIHKAALNYYGKIYGLPLSRNNSAREGWGYRLDWANKLNINVEPGKPVTLEVFEEMLDKFTNNDPDGDGNDNTVGLFLDSWTGAFDIMQLWFGVPNGWGIAEDDSYAKYNIKKGDLVPAQLTEEYKVALRKFREWYQAGYINQDFLDVGGGDAVNKADNGLRAQKGGIGVQVLDGLRKVETYLESQGFVEENAPIDEALISLSGYVDTGLGGYCRPQKNGMNGFIAISKLGNINTEEKLKDALYVLDQLSDGWFNDLYSWGWVGEETKENQQATYYIDADGYANKFDGKPEGELTAAQAWGVEYDGKYSNGFNQVETFNYAEGHEPTVPTAPYANPTQVLENELYAEDFEYLVFDASTGCVSPKWTESGKEISAIIEEARKSFITDAGYTETNLEAAIQQWLDAGMQTVINEMNEQYHAAN